MCAKFDRVHSFSTASRRYTTLHGLLAEIDRRTVKILDMNRSFHDGSSPAPWNVVHLSRNRGRNSRPRLSIKDNTYSHDTRDRANALGAVHQSGPWLADWLKLDGDNTHHQHIGSNSAHGTLSISRRTQEIRPPSMAYLSAHGGIGAVRILPCSHRRICRHNLTRRPRPHTPVRNSTAGFNRICPSR